MENQKRERSLLSLQWKAWWAWGNRALSKLGEGFIRGRTANIILEHGGVFNRILGDQRNDKI